MVLYLLYAYRRTDRLSDIIRLLAGGANGTKVVLLAVSSNTCELILAIE